MQMVFKFHFHVPHFHTLHHHNHSHHHVLKRCVPIIVVLNYPLFFRLLREADKVYTFQHVDPITIPCHDNEFKYVQWTIYIETHHRLQLWTQ